MTHLYTLQVVTLINPHSSDTTCSECSTMACIPYAVLPPCDSSVMATSCFLIPPPLSPNSHPYLATLKMFSVSLFLFCWFINLFLGSTYKWNHMTFVFLLLSSRTVPSRPTPVGAGPYFLLPHGRVTFLCVHAPPLHSLIPLRGTQAASASWPLCIMQQWAYVCVWCPWVCASFWFSGLGFFR